MILRHKRESFSSSFFRIILFIFCAIGICNFAASQENQSVSVIKIENAQQTAYSTDEETGSEVIELSGAVSITVTKDGKDTQISASNIKFNRETSMLYAEGNVNLKSSSGAEDEQNISANTLLFNTSTMEGIFDNGKVVQAQSNAINLPSGSTVIVVSDIFGRAPSSTIAFKNATLTFCQNPDPHWKIWASRIWLLPGDEFAFFNAVLFIGHIPVLYLPAFYYPKDELIYNPSFGYDKRKGYFFQNTFYILGRKPLEEASDSEDDIGASLYNFMRPSVLKQQKREGLVLHNLEEKYTGDTSNYLKLMADYYTTLGGFVGIDGSYKNEKYIEKLNGTFQLGFSNTVFYNASSGQYIPYSTVGDVYSDKSNFLGLELPFRYGADIELKIKNPLTLSLSLPIYSDPYFNEDFGERSEYMDWISFFMSNAQEDDDDEDASITSLTWSLSGSYKAPVFDFLKPYISSIEFTSFSSQMIFSSKSNSLSSTDGWSTYTPERMFYYPSSITPLKFSLKIAGTIFETSASKDSPKNLSPSFLLPLEVPEGIAGQKDEDDSDESSKDNSNIEEGQEDALSNMTLPVLETNTLSSNISFENFTYTLGYSINPQFTSQLTYDSTALEVPADFEWENLQSSYLQVKVPITLNNAVSFKDSFFSLNNSLLFSPVYQEHPQLNGYTSASENSIKATDYAARKLDLSDENIVSIKPLVYNNIFKESEVKWTTNFYLIRTEFLGDVDDPKWSYITTDLSDEDCVTTHTLSALVSAKETDDISQSLQIATTLPPQKDEYTGTLGFTFPYTTLSFAIGVKKNSNDEWEKEPFKQSLSLKLFSENLVFTESFNYNLEDSYADSLKLSLTAFKKLQLSYVMSYTYGYDFDTFLGWQAKDSKEFLPETASFALSLPAKTYYKWKNRISVAPSLDSSIVYDCLRPTNSYFKFIPALNFKINDFLTLKFSAETRNSVIYRYFQNFTGNNIELPGETNVFKDLLNSFAFWGDDSLFDSEQIKRKSSGFKLKSLKLTVTHELCDWDFAASYSVSPRLVTTDGKKQYSFDPYISISVIWRPMSSLKTSIVDNYGTWELNSTSSE